MIKKNKIKIIIASFVILLPMLLGVIFWDKLPEIFATHWGIDGEADSFASKTFFVFGMPLIMLALFAICIFTTARDKKNKDQNKKVFSMIIWLVPFISIFVSSISYFGAIGKSFEIVSALPIILGALYAFMGNYMPKCKPNRTIGFKIKWTLENEENWNATHRFGGKMCVIAGLLMIFCFPLPEFWGLIASLILVLISTLITFFYSFVYYKKQKKEGTYVKNSSVKEVKKSVKIVIGIIIAAILIGCAILMFTGNVTIIIDEQILTVSSEYWSETSFSFDSIDTIQYIDNFDGGMRSSGFHSAKLALGNYENEKYKYLSYRYTGVDACVVMFTDHGIIAINQSTKEATKALYDELMAKTID